MCAAHRFKWRMTDVAAIILAAGLSRRMGTNNKLLLPVGGIPMIRHVVMQYRSALSGPITVVTGHEAPQVTAALEDLEVDCAFHAGFEQGQQTSVAFGLSKCPDAEVVLIGLGDQPYLRAEDITTLVEAHHNADPNKISIPALDGTRGNPIAVPRALRPRLTADPSRPGCMRFTRDNPQLVQRNGLTARGFYCDVDTPDAYALVSNEEDALS